jgi:Spy/CpxP family protein refolding chaperone
MKAFDRWRRVALAAMAGTLVAGVGFNAMAHGGGHGWHRGGEAMDPAKMDERIEHMVKRMLERVDATEEQRAKVATIAKAAAGDLRGLRGRQQELRAKGIELLAAPAVDRNAIERLRAEQMKLADEASKRVSLALADTAEVLTPEQRAKMAERIKERHSRHRRG